METSDAQSISYDVDQGAIRVGLSLPSNVDWGYTIELTNSSNEACNLPLVFNELNRRGITGTSMLLQYENDGSPLGIPVQISKNWHVNAGVLYAGSWIRGFTQILLQPGETKRMRLQVVTGYWGDAAAASHAQLSLIGYGGNWKWDQAALGSWGESITYDPTYHLARAMMADVRPTFTTPMNANTPTNNWTENSGGGNFLTYFDSTGQFRSWTRLKTAYRWAGPNIAEVLYSGVTDDEKIRFTYTTRTVSTNEYHRRFHGYKYEFIGDVISPNSLVFHQMAADYYRFSEFDNYYIGGLNGLDGSYNFASAQNGYFTQFSFSDQWLVIEDSVIKDSVEKFKTNRVLIDRGATLNGSPFNTYMHGKVIGGRKMLFELSSNSISRSYTSGDIVEGELEFMMTPKQSSYYWGTDTEFAGRLSSYTAAWHAANDEFTYNHDLVSTVHAGLV